MASFFDELEGLLKGGAKAAPAPVAAIPSVPAPAIAPRSAAESTQSVHADPYADLERYDGPKGAPGVIAKPAPIAAPEPDSVLVAAAQISHEPVIVAYVPEPAGSSMPAGTKLFDESNKLRGYLTADGRFVAVTAEPEDSLNRLSEADRRLVDPAEEADPTLPSRSAGRISYLLATYEKGHPERTTARIENDLHRALFARTPSVFDPERSFNAAEINRFKTL